MPKKKKPKRGLSGKSASSSPSSSDSTQSSGATKQASGKILAGSSPIKLDLAAAIADGSEPQASEQNSPEVIETPTKDSRSSLSIPAVAQASAGLETPSAQAAIAANPENETAVARSEPPHATATANSTPSPILLEENQSLLAMTSL
ncbi:hypothetical protein HID58_015280 [Brassica napus]|uniref:Uncharacterized protein n=1 Tax=Brassica napus TaxID=3708 RepID=A0ABQ8DK02_BRANA|nr:hypothetical protein HID58_015280 [Brassica napus]